MAIFTLRGGWWVSKLLALFFLFFGGAFASNWANDFKDLREQCGTYNICFFQKIVKTPSFLPFLGFFVASIFFESQCIRLGNEIERKNLEDSDMYQYGLQKIKNERESLELDTASKTLEKEKIKEEIKRLSKKN